MTEFNSDNTTRLDVEQVKEKLLSLEYIRSEIAAWGESVNENIGDWRKGVRGSEPLR